MESKPRVNKLNSSLDFKFMALLTIQELWCSQSSIKASNNSKNYRTEVVPSLQIVNFESSYAIKFKDLINNNYGKANIFMYNKTIKSFRAMQELFVYTPFTFICRGHCLTYFLHQGTRIFFHLKCLFTQARGKEENIFPLALSL